MLSLITQDRWYHQMSPAISPYSCLAEPALTQTDTRDKPASLLSRKQERMSDTPLLDGLRGHPRYEPLRLLKNGAFGSVVLAQDKLTGELVALKMLPRAQVGPMNENEVLNQMKLCSSRHMHIVTLFEVFLTDNHLVLVLEYCPGGDLSELLPPNGLYEAKALWLFQQLIFALEFAHRMGIASRDVKLENLVYMPGKSPIVKMCDWGLSVECGTGSEAMCQGMQGTPMYLPPEVLRTTWEGLPYDAKKADVWSCGVLLYKLLTGSFPFSRAEDAKLPRKERFQALVQRIQAVDFVQPAWVSPSCQDLLSKLLNPDPQARPSVAEILMHPWCCQSLQPSAMLQCNDAHVAACLANQPMPELLWEVCDILREAAVGPATPTPASAAKVPPGSGSSEACSDTAATRAWLASSSTGGQDTPTR